MKKKYKAMGAMSLALTTAFISANGVGVLRGNATTVGATYVDMTDIQNTGGLHSSNAGYVETSAGIDESNYGEWIIEREPTYEQDGLRKREYVASDGTFYVQYETIPRLILPPEPSDPRPEPTRSSDSGDEIRPSIPDKNIATKSDANKSFGHTSGKKKRIENSDNLKKGTKASQSGNSETKNSATNEETRESSTQKAETAKQPENKSGHKHKRNDSVSKSEADKNVHSEVNTDSTIADNANENNTFTSLPDITETSTEISNNNEVINETAKASTNTDESIPKSSLADKSFNRYDGATLLAAGAYAWWIAIVLLPMINAVKWINKKRREKSRGNVNKKYN